MNINHRTLVMIRGLFWAFLLATIVACGVRLSYYKGKTVPEANRIPLEEGGPHESVWKTKHLSLAYNYTKNRETIRLYCDIELNKRVFGSFDIVTHIFFRVNFIDMEGKITRSKIIWNPGFSENVRKWSFTSELDIPPNATGMVFNYEGSARETQGGSEGPGVNIFDFWISPTEPHQASPFFQ